LVARPTAGRLGDERGRRPVMVGGAAVMAAATAAFLLASDVAVLAVLRLLQGVGEATFYVGAATAVTDLVPVSRRGQAVSYFSAAVYAGLAVGPLVAEWISGADTYGRVWVLATALSALAATMALRLPEPPRSPRRRSRARLLHPAGLVPGSVFGLATLGYAAFTAFMPLYALTRGLAGPAPVFAVFAAITVVGRLTGAQIPDALGPATTARGGLVMMATGSAVLAGCWTAAGLWSGVVLFAVGNAFMFPGLLGVALGAAPDGERAAVVGTVVAFFDLSQGVGALLLGAVVALAGYPLAFLTGAVGAVVGLVVLAGADRRSPGLRRSPQHRPDGRELGPGMFEVLDRAGER